VNIVDRIDEHVSRRRLLDHPFYSAWSKGELTREALQTYAAQYYHWVYAFPTWVSAAHSNAPSLEMRQALLANLRDEEEGPENHPELWLRFSDALGLDRRAVTGAELLPETKAAIEVMRNVCRNEPAVAGVAALYAYESQQPEVMKVKREGLRDLYGVRSGHDYFEVHETIDVDHRAEEREIVASHAAGHEDAVTNAAEIALDAIYTLLDGVERVRRVH
jgi:pyrroloquinoline-quinone synthase